MKAHLVQMAPRLGNLRANLDRHLEALERAREEKAELVVFPELGLTGYTLKDLVPDVAVNPSRSPLFKELLDAGRGMSVVVGFVEEKEDERGLFYNSSAFLAEGRVLHVHRKVFLPTFGMFEEAKFFAQGRNVLPFRAPFGKAGMMICRDFLQYGSSYLLFAGGAEVFIVVSAAPGRGVSGGDGFETSRMWELMGEAIAHFSTAFVLYCNRVGSEDGVTFAGGSFVFGPEGTLLARAPDVDEAVLACDLDLGLVRDVRKRWTFKRDERPEIVLHSLERIVRGYED
ncbi:MAG TPA: nitrilase-related carbon-nitrogen hydrolase [Acidobacteriota bacterium]|nr:nitrilase-related carbon-nitrogen hydrolase [Acidobacteriota bacterium]